MLRSLQRLWRSTSSGVGQAALILATASVVSRLLGVLRDRLLAVTFGAGWELDAYYAAFRLPDTLYNLVILGALSAGFLPVYAALRTDRGTAAANLFAGQVLRLVMLVFSVGGVVGAIFAPQLLPLFVRGFTGERLDLAIQLTRVLFVSPLFLGMSAIVGGVLQTYKRTLVFALAPIWYNLGIVFGLVVLTRFFGMMGVAIGVVCGAFFHMATQVYVARQEGVKLRGTLTWTPDLTHLLKITFPRLAALGASQASLLITLGFASALPIGSVAVLQLGNNLQSFPLGVIGISFAIAAFPLLSEAAGAKNFVAYHETLEKAGRKILFFLVPVSLLFILLRAQIVRLVLGDGAFDWRATIDTAAVVGWMSVSLVAQAMIPLLARAFYAVQSTWTPFVVTLFAEALNVTIAWFAYQSMGVQGLAMAFTLAAWLQAVALWIFLRRRVGKGSERGLGAMLALALVGSIPALGAAWAGRQLVGTRFPLSQFWQVALQFGVAFGAACAVYVGMLWLFQQEEAVSLVRRVRALILR